MFINRTICHCVFDHQFKSSSSNRSSKPASMYIHIRIRIQNTVHPSTNNFPTSIKVCVDLLKDCSLAGVFFSVWRTLGKHLVGHCRFHVLVLVICFELKLQLFVSKYQLSLFSCLVFETENSDCHCISDNPTFTYFSRIYTPRQGPQQ